MKDWVENLIVSWAIIGHCEFIIQLAVRLGSVWSVVCLRVGHLCCHSDILLQPVRI